MKKLILSLAVLGVVLALASCNKTKNDGTSPQTVTQGVSFSITPGQTPGGLKSDCFSQTSSYAKVWLNVMPANTPYNGGNPITVTIFYLAGLPYTNSIQLPPGTYALEDFIIYNDNQTPTNTADDIVLAAVPHTNSKFAPYVSAPIVFNFTVAQFAKVQVPVEAVCYTQTTYSNFGFVFFQITEENFRNQVFFGDLCAKDYALYTGSDYALQHTVSGGNPLQPDMPAIFKIDVYRNSTLFSSNNNDSTGWYGVGRPMRVYYADRVGIEDDFEFKLSVLVKTGSTFSFVYFTSWYAKDGGPITSDAAYQHAADVDGNGVIDFALGYCSPNADLQLPPWMNLPPTCSYQITGAYNPGSLGGYVDAALSNVGTGYDFANGTFASWCVDYSVTITVGQTYNMNVYSSLWPNLMPTFAQAKPWDKINWILNHLDWYPGYHWYDLQGAIWTLCGWIGPTETGVPWPLALPATTMVSDANTYGSGYKVPTGGWACVVFIAAGTPNNASVANVQTMITKVDP